MIDEFLNEPLSDFSKPEPRREFMAALETVGAALGREYPLVIGGDEIRTREKITSYNPADKRQVVCVTQKAGSEWVERAMAAAVSAYATWQYVPAAERAAYAFKAAGLMRRRKHEFSAWLVQEVSKSWAEADGDTAEAIDFLEFYGREAVRYGQPQPVTALAGEMPSLRWLPLGVGVVIPPWNFPLAILAGMTTAAFVSGNTVILKPSSDAPGIAWQFFELLREAGLPPGVVNFCPGAGASFGDKLVQHPQTRFIAFTGSKTVGLHIVEEAARVRPGQLWIKRVIAEMGGKDTILVADDADLDRAAEAITWSAFGFQGQKCSACSRVVVDATIYQPLLARVTAKTRALTIGDPRQYGTYMGAVINQSACQSILEYIEVGKQEARLVCGGEALGDRGYHIQPTIFADVAEGSRLDQEEIFGPVLAFLTCNNFEDGLRIANSTEYGLTGSVFTQSAARKELARQRFHVGNLYINRKCTGALVGVHPFGGFNMSGTNSKAGGREYLAHFQEQQAICEKIQ